MSRENRNIKTEEKCDNCSHFFNCFREIEPKTNCEMDNNKIQASYQDELNKDTQSSIKEDPSEVTMTKAEVRAYAKKRNLTEDEAIAELGRTCDLRIIQ